MESPRYNDKLDIQYILVKTDYNNRALADKACVTIMDSSMRHFMDIHGQNEVSDKNSEHDDTPYQFGNVYILPYDDGIELLYTKHAGYTWIDQETAQNMIYYNGACDEDAINEVSALLCHHGVDDAGCFVFKTDLHEINFNDILNDFISPLTGIQFCGFFNMRNLSSVMYEKETKSLIFEFDTESG